MIIKKGDADNVVSVNVQVPGELPGAVPVWAAPGDWGEGGDGGAGSCQLLGHPHLGRGQYH